MNEVSFGQEARQKLKIGLAKVSEAVASTLGPAGRNVLIEKGEGQPPVITNDGVTVARSIQLEDHLENLGASLIRQVAETADKAAGDGTTTATVIAHAIIQEGLKLVESGANPILLRDGILAAKKEAVESLKRQSRTVQTLQELESVATISAENEEMGKTVAEVVHKIGKDGVVTIEQSPVFGIQSEFIDGFETYGGFCAPFMITDKDRQRAVLEDSAVIVTDKFLHQAIEIIPLVRTLIAQGKKSITIFALDFDFDVLEFMILNSRKGNANILGVKISEVNHEIVLADIAASVGATVVTKIHGDKLEEAPVTVVGHAQKVIADMSKTILVAPKTPVLEEYIHHLEVQLEEDIQEKRKKSLQRRIAKLSGGIAVVRLGAPSDSELSYMRHKLEDTINAAQAAAEEGIVPGGGVALAQASQYLDHCPVDDDHDWKAGYSLLKKAICQPLLKIVQNKGKRNAESVLEHITDGSAASTLLDNVTDPMQEIAVGYDARNDRYVDMFEKGIIDPLKVTRNSLEKAVSVATLVLTTEVAVTIKQEKQ